MGPDDGDPGPRRSPDAPRLFRQPSGRRAALAAPRARHRRVPGLGAHASVEPSGIPARHVDRRRARRRGRLVAGSAPHRGRKLGDPRARLGRRGEAGGDPFLGLDRRHAGHPRRRTGGGRRREIHGPRVPELPRALSRDASGRPLDVGSHDQLLLLGLPARRGTGEALGRPAADRLQPRPRVLHGLLLRLGGVPRPPALTRRSEGRSRLRGTHRLRRQSHGSLRCLGESFRRRLRLLARLARDRPGAVQDDQRVPVLHVLPRRSAPPPSGVSIFHRRLRRGPSLDRSRPPRDEARVALDPARGSRLRHGAGRELLEPPGHGDPAGGGRSAPAEPRRTLAEAAGRPRRRGHRRGGVAAVSGPLLRVQPVLPARESRAGPSDHALGIVRAPRRLGHPLCALRRRPLAAAAFREGGLRRRPRPRPTPTPSPRGAGATSS